MTMTAAPGTPTAPRGALSPTRWDPETTTSADLQDVAGVMQGAEGYKPDDSALVSNQLSKLLQQDNPYMQRAVARANEYSNSRCLLNSSIAAGAGTAAAIDSALPIAQQDAQTNFTSQRDSWGARNEFARDANQFRRQGALQVAQAGFGARENELDRGFRTDMMSREQAFTTQRDATQFTNRLREIEALTTADLQRLDAQQGTNLANDYRAATQRTYDDYAAAVSRIQESDMDPDVKDAQVAELQSLFT